MERLLLQLDGDPHASAFDAIVAYDAGAGHVLQYGGVREEDVQSLVYGAIFTRGLKHLHETALFLGGSDLALGERMLAAVEKAFFAGFRVSVMLDPNGSNTTAAAAVRRLVDAMGGDVAGRRALVVAGTGPVGTRSAGLLAHVGAEVRITARAQSEGEEAVRRIAERFGVAVASDVMRTPEEMARAVSWAEILLATGPAGVRLVDRAMWTGNPDLRVVTDVNAVPPSGIEGVEPGDDGEEREGVLAFGALGIGNLKMKVHRASIARLFERNDLILDAEAIYDLTADL